MVIDVLKHFSRLVADKDLEKLAEVAGKHWV